MTPARSWMAVLGPLLLGPSLLACPRPPSPTVQALPEVTATSAASSAADPADLERSCLRYAGPPEDPDLRGQPREHPVRCCASDYGFDPQRVVAGCELAAYLGESEELACVHRFRAADGSVRAMRLVALLDRDLAGAIAELEQAELGSDAIREAPAEGLWWAGDTGRRWALVDGWPVVRRLSWDEATCAPGPMLPVLSAMTRAPADPHAAVALPRLFGPHPSPDPSPHATDPSLLDWARRDLPAGAEVQHPLPRAAEALARALLAAAAADDHAGFAALLDPAARLGLPDRRQLGARSIAEDLGVPVAMAALRDAAARLPDSAALICPSLDRRARPLVARGEAWMWCFWRSDDGLDLLVLGLRGHVRASAPEADSAADGAAPDEGDGRVVYLGVFPDRPLAPLVVPGEPPPPPLVPTPPLDCRDPHARSYPDRCPPPPDPAATG